MKIEQNDTRGEGGDGGEDAVATLHGVALGLQSLGPRCPSGACAAGAPVGGRGWRECDPLVRLSLTKTADVSAATAHSPARTSMSGP